MLKENTNESHHDYFFPSGMAMRLCPLQSLHVCHTVTSGCSMLLLYIRDVRVVQTILHVRSRTPAEHCSLSATLCLLRDVLALVVLGSSGNHNAASPCLLWKADVRQLLSIFCAATNSSIGDHSDVHVRTRFPRDNLHRSADTVDGMFFSGPAACVQCATISPSLHFLTPSFGVSRLLRGLASSQPTGKLRPGVTQKKRYHFYARTLKPSFAGI